MSGHTHDDLFRALGRGELAPVYYLYGPEEIVKDEALRLIVDKALEPHERDFNLDQRSAQQLDPDDLHALVNTLPMMAARRLVVIRDIEVWKKKTSPREVLQRYLENPSNETVLALIEGPPNEDKRKDSGPDEGIVARAYAVDFQPLAPDRVIRWIAHHARRLDITFAEGAAQHLAVACGYELGLLGPELEKFGSLSSGEPITRDMVGDIVGIRHGETLEDWVEALLGGDAPRALALGFRVLEQSGMSGVKMVSTLGTAFVGLRLARAHYDKGSKGGTLERVLFERLRVVRPFGIGEWKVAVSNWSTWAEMWPAARLSAAVRASLEADAALKGTRVSDDAGVIADLILRLTESGGAGRRPALAGAATIRSDQ
jgi:DNA polymerase III subunit delta